MISHNNKIRSTISAPQTLLTDTCSSTWLPGQSCSQPESPWLFCIVTYLLSPSKLELDFIVPNNGSRKQLVSMFRHTPLSGTDSCRDVLFGDELKECDEIPLGKDDGEFSCLKLAAEHFLKFSGSSISSWPVSSSCTEDRGTSRQGKSSRGLFAKNSTISLAVGRSLASTFQQDLIKPSL